ncbi:MAG: ABC transporter permease, partial [Planctomycetota bacterium]|nr:ABC transporter permease [Planctomycetota bacterium]
WEPRYLIPFLGMVLGNGLTGISLGLERCLRELDEGRVRVECLLALGATRWEASRVVAGEAVRAGMVPILNSMTVVGLVTIPGMMTGQLLGGVSPLTAARYQILIMFLIAATTAGGVTVVVVLCLRALFDDTHRLRLERLHRSRGE